MKTLLSSSSIVLKIHIVHAGATKSIPLDLNAPIYAVCEHIRSMIREAEPETGKESKDYGLFLPHEMSKNGLWLDNMKNLVQYILKPGDTLEYRYRFRWLTIRTQDDIKKTLLVDDSWTVAELMILLCAKMGILNHEEYSLIKTSQAIDQSKTSNNPKVSNNEKEQDKLEKMKKKLQTDDDLNWLNPSQTLRQQGVDEQEVLLVQRKYFFSDMNIDTRDPIQLSLLFIQCKEAILNGKHPVSVLEAEQLAALQCQGELGDISTNKNKLTKISLKECLPKDYVKSKGIEKRIVKIYSDLRGKDNIEAKREYCALCRSLKTYGITFFLVKEKIKGKSKLIPRLLGVSRDRVLRLDEKTKEILKTWPLTSIRRWAGSFNAFTMDFGEYAPNEYYTAQTNKGEQISQLISGYVDIIIKHQKSQEPQNSEGFEESAVAEIKIEPNQAEIVEHRSSLQTKSFEDISKELHIAIATPTDELSHPISVVNSSQIDVTFVTSLPQSAEDQTFKSDQDDFDNINLTAGNRIIETDLNTKPKLNLTLEDRELESAMSFGTSRSVHNYSVSRNTVNSPDIVRAMNHSPDSFMTGGTRICHRVRRLNIGQQSLVRNINVNLEKLQQSSLLLDDKLDKKSLVGIDKPEERKNIQVLSKEHAIYNLGSMNTEVVQVLRSSKHAPLGVIDTEKANENSAQHLKDIEKSFRIITVHFPSFVDNVRMISEINSSTIDDITEIKTTDAEEEMIEESPETIIDAARRLANAFSGMLTAVKPQEEERDIDFRKAILDAANKVGEASSQLFKQITFSDKSLVTSTDNCSRLGRLLQNSDHDYEDGLIYLVRSVANATANLVQTVKTVTQNENTSEVIIGCQKLIGPVTLAGLATSQLVTCVKILAPTINQANCTNQILTEIEEVRCTIDNVAEVTSVILSNCQSEMENSHPNILLLHDIEDAITNVRLVLENLEDHLRCGITIVNFAPRIQSLELFLIEYYKLKNFFGINLTNSKKFNKPEEISEMLENFLMISGKINEEITFLFDQDQTPDDPLLVAQKLFLSILVKILNLNKGLLLDNSDVWRDLHFEIDKLVLCVLYEPGTKFITHDQLIHNLYRSAQILITCCHKLITSYHQVVLNNQFSPEYSDVKERSEYILLIMNNLKLDPTNEKTIVCFIRESEKLAQSCVAFCRTIHKSIPNINDDIMIDIMAVAASQTLAECEHMEQTIICIRPIRAHLELLSVAKMLQDHKLENLQKTFTPTNQPKVNLSQLFQITIAMLEKIRNNIEQTLPKAHYSSMFEMNNVENTESSLLINLYHYFVKINEIIDSNNDNDMQQRFKNVILLMYRLIMVADNILISYGQHSGEDFPLMKNIDEIISTVSSLQSKSENIFEKFKLNILNKQNIFRSKASNNSTKSNIESLNSFDVYFEKGNANIKTLIESALMCRQSLGNPKLLDNLRNLYQAYDEIAENTEYMLCLSGDPRIIDEFMILSLSLLNFVLEIENSMSITSDQLLVNRVSNKYRAVSESATKLQQILSLTFENYLGKFKESIIKLRNIKKSMDNSPDHYPIVWDLKSFIVLINKNKTVRLNSEELKVALEKQQTFTFDTQLLEILGGIYDIYGVIIERFRPFEERNQIINRSIDLSLNVINVSLKANSVNNSINMNRKIGFILKDLTDNVSFLINCVREQIPGYKECSSALAIVAQLSHDINEIEFSIASESETSSEIVIFEEDNKKKCANWLYKMGHLVFNIQNSLEREVIPDEKLPGHIDEFTFTLSELMGLICTFAKRLSTSIEIRTYVGCANELVERVDTYLQDVKQFFENIGTDHEAFKDLTMRNLIKQTAVFLQLFDNEMAQNLLEAMDKRTKSIKLADLDQNLDMANTMSGMITDDDTTILFASAGIKNSDFENCENILSGQFLLNGEQKSMTPYKKDVPWTASNDFRNLILKTAEALVHDTQSLVQNSGDKQKSLATNTESVIMTISNLADECENGFIDENRKSSEAKMMEAIRSVRSALDNTYNDKSAEVSRLIVSNSTSLVQQDMGYPKPSITDNMPADDTILNIEKRLDRFIEKVTHYIDTSTIQKNSDVVNTKIDGSMEKLVNQASSVLALSSELMRMPFQKLFQNSEQCKTVSFNIGVQCQAILFDYLDSLEELAYSIRNNKINQKIIFLGKSLSFQFIKFFQILQKIQEEPDNKFIKSSMLDVFYEIQNEIKIFLEFSEEVQKSLDNQVASPRKVSFRETSPITVHQTFTQNHRDSPNKDPLLSLKDNINQLNKIMSDLLHPNQNLVSHHDVVYLKSFINLITRFAQVSSDLIGLSKHSRETGDLPVFNFNTTFTADKDISDCFDKIIFAVRTCVYGKYRNLEDQINKIKNFVTDIASKSAELLVFYQKKEIKSSWQELLQNFALDLRNISREILSFKPPTQTLKETTKSGQVYSYMSSSIKSSKLSN